MWVLDTNVVLDVLLFDDPVARPLRQALEAGRMQCVVTDATLDELKRVLAYPDFALDAERQAALVTHYQTFSSQLETSGTKPGLPHKETPIHYGLTSVCGRLPRCSDPDDQKFIELAASVQAQSLVSKDRAVLKLRRLCAQQFQIMTPAEAVRWLGGNIS